MTTDKPSRGPTGAAANEVSIESLRDYLEHVHKGIMDAGWCKGQLRAALTELAALRKSDAALRAENEALRAERDTERARADEAEANYKSADADYRIFKERWNAERARADALAAKWAIAVAYAGPVDDPAIGWRGYAPSTPEHFCCEKCRAEHLDCFKIEHKPWCSAAAFIRALSTTPAADLEAHDARVRRDALEGAWERIESEPEFPGEMPTEVWNQTRDATKEQFEAAMRGLLRAWKAKAKAALFGPKAQPNGQEGK